ncbi:hypothetical protein ED312_22635 [Sinomicrobium pectinilyticum]|uniref:Uncharacterized protein n=1 Tax=Sinomicrobium pectinilyticum TaxID=1084421 RepID=A0A3N0D153_SINP1|nr:hypothetical protein ED312_22635 [Sinomicrobium pectinilyticum]
MDHHPFSYLAPNLTYLYYSDYPKNFGTEFRMKSQISSGISEVTVVPAFQVVIPARQFACPVKYVKLAFGYSFSGLSGDVFY